MPPRRCEAPKRASPARPHGHCRPRRESRAPEPPAIRRARRDSFTSIAAPFDGMVTEKMVEPGNMAAPGTPLLRLEDTRGFRLDVRVDESRIGQIRHGASVPVFLGDRDAPRSRARWRRSAGRWMRMRARFSSRSRCPTRRASLREFGQARFGWHAAARADGSVGGNRAPRADHVGLRRRATASRASRLVSVSETEVLAGLTEAEMVILSPPAGVTDGRRVSVGGR